MKTYLNGTVKSEIIARVLFSLNGIVKTKSSRNGEITLSFTDIGRSCHSNEFLTPQICLLTLFAKKILAKISEFTVFDQVRRLTS